MDSLKLFITEVVLAKIQNCKARKMDFASRIPMGTTVIIRKKLKTIFIITKHISDLVA